MLTLRLHVPSPSPCPVGPRVVVLGLREGGGKVAGPGGGGAEPAHWRGAPWVPPSLLEVGFQPEVARLLQGPARQGWGGVGVGDPTARYNPSPRRMSMLRGVSSPPSPPVWGRLLGEGGGVD